MGRVFYVRHGQSETNLRGVFAGGQDDTPLTDLGRQQARQAGQELNKDHIDHIICSPLSRTYETAQIIAREIGFDAAKIKKDARLQEYDIGSGNGMPVDGMTAVKMIALPGAENPQLFAERVRNALFDISKLNGTTVIAGHAGVGRIIECLKTNRNPAEFFDIEGYPNGQAIKLDLRWLE